MIEEIKPSVPPTEIKPPAEKKDNKVLPEWLSEWLPSILSTVTSMGGSYLFMVKPLQDKVEALSKQISEMQFEIKELRQENKEYEKEFENIKLQLENNLSGGDYLPIKKSIGQGSYFKKRI